MFNIIIKDAAAATIGKITNAVAKAGVGVEVRVDSRWRLIGRGKLIQLSIAPSHRAEFADRGSTG